MIKNEKFYEAHEVLEEIWFPRRKRKDKETLVLKGFINASVALEWAKRGEREKALKVWKTYNKYKSMIETEVFKKMEIILDTYYQKYIL